ncbi:MAG TPA: two-component regulator propeller domain-containing protein, partial [Verrucomicrobiae bacterium]|nr:two-component regulator propeller domain-containing protein [Verrucomicrobiae bacterium]
MAPGLTAWAGENRGPGTEAYDIWPVDGDQEQNAVTALIQSGEGYLWLGTYHGLTRFDGVRFTVFDSGNSPGLPNGLITSLYEDSQGVLWIGHETGQLTRLTNRGFESVPLGPKWPGGSIESIAADDQDDIWLLNAGGLLYRIRDQLAVAVPGGASATRKVELVRGTEGRLWVVSNGSVATLERGQILPFQFEPSGLTDFVERVLPAHDGGLWVLASQRLRKWKAGRWTVDLDAGNRPAGSISVLLETREGSLLVGTLRDGLFLLRPSSAPVHFSRADGLSHDWVRALCEDHEGNIWIGTSAGFDSLRRRKVQMLNPPDQWQGCGVLSLALQPDGSAWVGTEGAGLYRFDGQHWTVFGETNGVSNPYVWSLLKTREGRLYAGTYGGGLLVQEGDHFEAGDPLNKITAPVLALYEGRDNKVWIGTTAGLYHYDGVTLTEFAAKDKLASPDIRAITETPDGALWLGLSGGG